MRKFKRDVLEEDEYKNNGRPDKRNLVIEYIQANPKASISQISKDLGISRTTVY